jgi:hypothetical protein
MARRERFGKWTVEAVRVELMLPGWPSISGDLCSGCRCIAPRSSSCCPGHWPRTSLRGGVGCTPAGRPLDRRRDGPTRREQGAKKLHVAESANARSLEDLSASIAHEIRNPVTAAKSLVQQMGEDPVSGDNIQFARVALEELDREIGGTELRGQLRGFRDQARRDAAKSDLVELKREMAARIIPTQNEPMLASH